MRFNGHRQSANGTKRSERAGDSSDFTEGVKSFVRTIRIPIESGFFGAFGEFNKFPGAEAIKD